MAVALLVITMVLVARPAYLAGMQQGMPDAPSATRPQPIAPPPLMTAPPPAGAAPAPGAAVETPDDSPIGPPKPSPAATENPLPPPTNQIQTRNGKKDAGNDRDQLFTLRTTVNFVVVPVTVRDNSGRLEEGLLSRDFSIYENGVPQRLTFFSSDPFPLSAAVVVDEALSDAAMRRVNETLPNLASAFSQYDQVAVYTYGSNVHREMDFNGVGEQLSLALRKARRPGRTGGVPVTGGPMVSGPTVNGRDYDAGQPHRTSVRRESSVLNDAILQAAQDLSRLPLARRKIILIISDGREDGSRASYGDVLKILLTHEIQVFAIAVDSAAIPGVNKLESMRIPGLGYGNILPKYVSATAGQSFEEFTRDSIQAAYARATEVARNQYTLGYTTKGTAASNYRSIEVRVRLPNLKVYAKEGYYPAAPARQE